MSHTESEEAKQPRIAGNDTYYQDIQREMDQKSCNMREAELALLHYCIKTYRSQGWTHQQIQAQFQKVWGLKKSAYQLRLQWVRERYALP